MAMNPKMHHTYRPAILEETGSCRNQLNFPWLCDLNRRCWRIESYHANILRANIQNTLDETIRRTRQNKS
jgi:hypothetical protein